MVGKYGLQIAGAEQTIHAVNLRGRDAELLQVAERRGGFLGDFDRLSPSPAAAVVGANALPRRRLRISQFPRPGANRGAGQRRLRAESDGPHQSDGNYN